MSTPFIGQTVRIPKGKQVVRAGQRVRQQRETFVTVTNVEPDRRGKTRIYWKSNGYTASALV